MSAPQDVQQFIEVYNDLAKYPSIADVAKVLGISIKTVRNKAGFIRSTYRDDPAGPKLVQRAPAAELPMSEDPSRFVEDWTAEDCIAELRRIAQIDPEMVVTRN